MENTQYCYVTRNFERTRQRALQTEPSGRDGMHHAQLLLERTVTVSSYIHAVTGIIVQQITG